MERTCTHPSRSGPVERRLKLCCRAVPRWPRVPAPSACPPAPHRLAPSKTNKRSTNQPVTKRRANPVAMVTAPLPPGSLSSLCRCGNIFTCWRPFVLILVCLPVSQLHVVDGALLRSNPALVMEGIQKFLGVTPIFNYTQALLSVTLTHTCTHAHTLSGLFTLTGAALGQPKADGSVVTLLFC